jgi:Uma2 family endonuclease
MEGVTTLPGNELTLRDLKSMPGFGLAYELEHGAIWIRSDRKLTMADLEAIADDELRRFELLDGEILVTAAPGDRHQAIVVNLIVLLKAACPPDTRVRPAPYDVMLGEHTVAQPDVVVARKSDITPRGLPAAPLLVIEVLSRSTRRSDLVRKKRIYADAGCPHYWIVDPGDETHPTVLTVWRLEDGQYAEVATVVGGESWSTDEPFPCSVVPRDLVD